MERPCKGKIGANFSVAPGANTSGCDHKQLDWYSPSLSLNAVPFVSILLGFVNAVFA